MKIIFTILIIISTITFLNTLKADDILSNGKISGNFQLDAQYYSKDSIIGASEVNEKVLSNGFLYLNYTNGSFSAGLRYEEYLNPLLGIDTRYKGSGIGYRFAEFNTEVIDVTVGNFYEQFGSGMIFRAYEDRLLGFDNSIDGIRVKFRPINGIDITGLIGNQRNFWQDGSGIIRGGDLLLNVNNIFESLLPSTLQLNLEGSVVSRYQPDVQSVYNLPLNVLAWSSKLSVSGTQFLFETEYGYKENDPNATNDYNFNPGKGLIVTASYFPSGLGISLSFHSIDNMDFRSDRDATGNVEALNFIPPLTLQHAYRLATLYPFATQFNGEIGVQGEVTYSIPKSFFGDKYGGTLLLNYSQVNSLNKTPAIVDTNNQHIYTYTSDFLKFGDRTYFRDLSLEFTKKWTSDFRTIISVINLLYDKDILENQGAPKYGQVKSTVLATEFLYQLTKSNAIRVEIQHIWAKQDSAVIIPNNTNGNWFYVLGEYSIAPNWFFSAFDEYNYGNHDADLKLHYLSGSVVYLTGTTRVSFGYGRQRGGLLCVGGVCRPVPASNGFLLSISSSF